MSEIKDKNYLDVQGSGIGLRIIEDKKMSKGNNNMPKAQQILSSGRALWLTKRTLC